MEVIADHVGREDPGEKDFGFVITSLRDIFVRDSRLVLFVRWGGRIRAADRMRKPGGPVAHPCRRASKRDGAASLAWREPPSPGCPASAGHESIIISLAGVHRNLNDWSDFVVELHFVRFTFPYNTTAIAIASPGYLRLYK
jgi:hypothetical protein